MTDPDNDTTRDGEGVLIQISAAEGVLDFDD